MNSDNDIFNQFHYDYKYNVKDRMIKICIFYINNILHQLELVKDDCKMVCYLNRNIISKDELVNYYDAILQTQEYKKEHELFIIEMEKILGKTSFQHKLKYGWYIKSKMLKIYKFREISCYIKELNSDLKMDEIILSKQEIFPYINELTKNNVLDEISKLTLKDKVNEVNEVKKHVNIQNKELIRKNTDFLFIHYPLEIRLEYQMCKKHDINEIKFYKEMERLNLND